MRPVKSLMFLAALIATCITLAQNTAYAGSPAISVAPQYDTTHVYVAPQDFSRFVTSLIATFGGKTSKQGVFKVTPTPSATMSQLVLTPVGTLSVFGFKTPVPYPFGAERTGYLVTDMNKAVSAAARSGADVIVSTFPDPIGLDTIVQWPGGVNMQLYWHTKAPNYAPLESVPENRVYVSAARADQFLNDFLNFSHGKIVMDNAAEPGAEIGRPDITFRLIRIESGFGRVDVFVTDGHLPYPYGREVTGYQVKDLSTTLAKGKAAGVVVLVAPYTSTNRISAVVQFPGGYIAEIHQIIPN